MTQTKPILIKDNIVLNCPSVTPEEAIVAAGSMLVDSGYVTPAYVTGMLERDKSLSVYIGNLLAIPHGEFSVKDEILHSGIVVRIYPNGIDWHGNLVNIVMGIAGKGEEHMQILANAAEVFEDLDTVKALVAHPDKDKLYELLA